MKTKTKIPIEGLTFNDFVNLPDNVINVTESIPGRYTLIYKNPGVTILEGTEKAANEIAKDIFI